MFCFLPTILSRNIFLSNIFSGTIFRAKNRYNSMKYNIFLLLSIVLLSSGCKKQNEIYEKPFYPAVGAINARFSVGDTVTVVFSQGNLQYQASTNTWRFAMNQYDIIGTSNEQIDTSYNGWIDLFGWATSGYNNVLPYMSVDSNLLYGPIGADINGTHYDWGQYNVVSNGGTQPGIWRTMTYEEWKYLFSFRNNAGVKRGLAKIEGHTQGNDIGGLVLLPDKWELPEGCSFRYGIADGFETNIYSIEQWMRMQGAGAVFLPVAGYRDLRKVSLVGEYGCYWTASYNDDETAYDLYIQSTGYAISTAAKSNGHSVRLVQNR